jgi:hypothetical protein
MTNYFILILSILLIIVVIRVIQMESTIDELKNKNNMIEGLDITGANNLESLENIASLYHDGKLIVKDIDITGNLKVTGNTDVMGQLDVKGGSTFEGKSIFQNSVHGRKNIDIDGDINMKNGKSIRSSGVLHIVPKGKLHLLPKGGTHVTKSWGGAGSINAKSINTGGINAKGISTNHIQFGNKWKLYPGMADTFIIRDIKSGGDNRYAFWPDKGPEKNFW